MLFLRKMLISKHDEQTAKLAGEFVPRGATAVSGEGVTFPSLSG